nr:methyltransferase domain-containing protein [uncultured Desulfobacter sp.]
MKLIRRVIEATTMAIARIKRNQKLLIRDKDSLVKVNLGCGLAVAPGWINIDGSLNSLVADWPISILRVLYSFSGANQYYTIDDYCSLLSGNRFVHHDLANSIPLGDASVDYIYSSHFLEHLRRDKAVHLISESYRVMKKGGGIRICVPDLAYSISLYQEGLAQKEKMLQRYFFVEDMSSSYAEHKYMYDYDLLKKLLSECGFVNVRRCKPGQGEVPDLELLDNRPEDTLYVEAEKGKFGK